MRAGSTPLRVSAARSCEMKLAWASWRADTLTLTLRGGRSGNVSSHTRDWRVTSCTTHDPTGTIRPVSSSAARNSSGLTTPRVGSFQRSRASTPTRRLVHSDTTGW